MDDLNKELILRLEAKLDKIDEKLDKHSEERQELETRLVEVVKDVDWLKGYAKIGMMAVLSAVTGLISLVFGGKT
jgi:hypothetical protein